MAVTGVLVLYLGYIKIQQLISSSFLWETGPVMWENYRTGIQNILGHPEYDTLTIAFPLLGTTWKWLLAPERCNWVRECRQATP